MVYVTWTDGFGAKHRSFVLSTFWDDGFQYAVIKHMGEFRVVKTDVEKTKVMRHTTELQEVEG